MGHSRTHHRGRHSHHDGAGDTKTGEAGTQAADGSGAADGGAGRQRSSIAFRMQMLKLVGRARGNVQRGLRIASQQLLQEQIHEMNDDAVTDTWLELATTVGGKALELVSEEAGLVGTVIEGVVLARGALEGAYQARDTRQLVHTITSILQQLESRFDEMFDKVEERLVQGDGIGARESAEMVDPTTLLVTSDQIATLTYTLVKERWRQGLLARQIIDDLKAEPEHMRKLHEAAADSPRPAH